MIDGDSPVRLSTNSPKVRRETSRPGFDQRWWHARPTGARGECPIALEPAERQCEL